ncbi:hypothetical protein SBOR_8690 [Sclerotinia borealis F-4128]|uniref:Uncharacterized protein n=1 Tax=Sclerotinia borealis (strain F-4128) TaxID=1432307 RepID=W9C5D2_SCLBF|nr:hypothetical protein SBOR_8690 [Sclerotinia borealis F-4128]
MASTSNTDCSDLVQVAQSSLVVQGLVKDLSQYFDPDTITEKEGYSRVECLQDESKLLQDIIDIIKTIVPRPKERYYMSLIVHLLVFQTGCSKFEEMVGKDDCIILIPVVIIGSGTGMLEEEATGRRTSITMDANSELVISGRCSLYLEPGSKAVCVVMSIGKDKDKDKL